ncbi:uncharacterized protein LOC141617872 [Silene latifolia]|uniref:uncharacterized protein LOC141617872 n=1 Tax=Silene latifolia TaxID=37657 RepID=UPI003D76A915
MICDPIFKKLRVGEHEIWDDQCQAAFDKVKEVLSIPPVLRPHVSRLPLSLYLTVTDTAMGAMLAQTVNKEERAIYYISKKFLEYEVKYTPLEKTCLAQVWATKKLRHYMLSYSVSVYSKMDPIKLVADFLADNLIEEVEILDTWSFPDEDVIRIEDDVWDLYFDGASNHMGYRCVYSRKILEGMAQLCKFTLPSANLVQWIGGSHLSQLRMGVLLCVVLASYYHIWMQQNKARVEACLLRLELVNDIIRREVKNRLVVHLKSVPQRDEYWFRSGSWRIKSDSLTPYQARIEELERYFDDVKYIHLPRDENQFADTLSKLTALLNIPEHMDHMPICVERRSSPSYVNAIDDAKESETEPWYMAILRYKETGEYSIDLDV